LDIEPKMEKVQPKIDFIETSILIKYGPFGSYLRLKRIPQPDNETTDSQKSIFKSYIEMIFQKDIDH
jgi:hypothetical protein